VDDKQKCMPPKRGFIENTIREQWTTVLGASEPCSARKALGGLCSLRSSGSISIDPDANQKLGAVSRIAGRVEFTRLTHHKKTDLGQARDRRTLREFQFPE
jgi:hypothetical protein